jgi:CheY-like chemotaxis protein
MEVDVTLGARILLVDDIPDQRAAYHRALVASGFDVTTTTSGAEALTLSRATAFDLGVIDVRLPDMSGWDLCAAIKRDPALASPPIVMLTPDLSHACATDGARSGCSAWLAHPARAEDVVRSVRHVLALERTAPATLDDALVGVITCPACQSDRVRPTLRISMIQYFCCTVCSFCWRVDSQPFIKPDAVAPVPIGKLQG